jgi:hypothetical protein
MLIAGRLVSLLSFFALVANVFWLIRRLGGTSSGSVFGAAIFAAILLSFAPAYVGVDDPQLLGDAVMLAGFNLFLARGDTLSGILATALVVILAGLIKHNQIAVPLAITVWLLLNDKPRFVRWIAVFFAVSAVAIAGLYASFGFNVFGSIFIHRHYAIESSLLAISTWWLPLLPLFVTALIFSASRWHDSRQNIVVAYLAASALEGLLVFQGVNLNIEFDLVIALSISAGLALDAFVDGIRASGVPGRHANTVAVLFLSLGVIFTSPVKLGGLVDFIVHGKREDAALRDQIAFIASHRGPVICEQISLCYWSGKAFELDPFNSHLYFQSHPGSESALLKRVSDKDFPVIQLNAWQADRNDDSFSNDFMQALLKNYTITMTNDRPASAIFVPRTGDDETIR